MARDNFDYGTKKSLAERVGFLCSFPGCNQLTIGPSEESESSVSGIGMACHIAAAAEKNSARRFVKLMSSEQRKSISNGIWLCYTHGKLVDTDEQIFTISMLEKWKEIATKRAQILLSNRASFLDGEIDFFGLGLAKVDSTVDIQESADKKIGDAIEYSCVPQVWGRENASVIRDFLIEVATNAIEHGKAKSIELSIRIDSIVMSDNGNEFNLWDLPKKSAERGGSTHMRALLQRMTDGIILSSSRNADKNQLTIAKIGDVDAIADFTSCIVKISSDDIRKDSYQIIAPDKCKMVYVIMPEYLVISGIRAMEKKLKMETHDQKLLIFVLKKASKTTIDLVSKTFPESRIVLLT
jgi:anti-sigma regulatory factor (Ser/Thr protein kinase)